jgi:hypothetical protein
LEGGEEEAGGGGEEAGDRRGKLYHRLRGWFLVEEYF